MLEMFLLPGLMAMVIINYLVMTLICMFIVRFIFGGRIHHISIFFWQFNLTDTDGLGKMSFVCSKRSYYPLMMFDFYKIGKDSSGERRAFLWGSLISGFIFLVIAVLMAVFIPTSSDKVIAMFKHVVVVSFGIPAVSKLLSIAITYIGYTKSIGFVCDEMQHQLHQAEDLSSIDLPPLEEIKKTQKSTPISELLYQMQRYKILEAKGDIEGLRQVGAWLDGYHQGAEIAYIKADIDRILIMHFSYWDIQPDRAKAHYDRSKHVMEKDLQFPTRRRLAYYYMYVVGDVNAAESLANQGVASLKTTDERIGKVDREIEKQFLENLLERIRISRTL